MEQLQIPWVREDGYLKALSPKVGKVALKVRAGDLLSGGQILAYLTLLDRIFALTVPQQWPWVQVAKVLVQRRQGVAYKSPLLIAQPLEGRVQSGPLWSEGEEDADLPRGSLVFHSPLEGMFYRKPSPDASPFIEIGDLIEPGQTIGLIEVMKFFYPLIYEKMPAGKVVRFLVEDGAPVEASQPILAILPEI